MSSDATAVPRKVDPETLVLRARPPRAIRFRRGAIIALAAVGSAGLMALAWNALEPGSVRREPDLPRPAEPEPRPPGDALEGLPATYADVPRLGPPLPGDLGRPIVRHAQGSEPADADRALSGGEAERAARDARAAEAKAARESPLLFNDGPRPAAPTEAMTAPGVAMVETDAPRVVEPDPGGQAAKARFVSKLDDKADINPHRLVPPTSPHLLSAGSVIAASLVTGLRSDLPGLVTAQVTEQVYDSPTGRTLLIPQGARLIGNYDSVVAFGQKRALVVWQRIILPDGSSLRLDNVPATDASGYAGLADRVDFHTWQLLKGVALSTLMGVAPELLLSSDSDLVEAIRRSTADSGARAGDQIVSKNLAVQPTITVRPGTPVRLVVHRDLVLPPWKG